VFGEMKFENNKTVLLINFTLLTIGDLYSIGRLARALGKHGFAPVVATTQQGIDIINAQNAGAGVALRLLPSLTARPLQPGETQSPFDSHGYVELTDRGMPYVDDIVFQQRRANDLVRIIDETKPVAVVTGHYPLGRRKFDADMLPALRHAKKTGAKIFSLARDLPLTSIGFGDHYNPERVRQTIEQLYDAVIVRGDRRVYDIIKEVPRMQELEERFEYAGYFTDADTPPYAGPEFILAVNHGDKIGAKQFFTGIIDASKHTVPEIQSKEWVLVTPSSIVEDLKRYAQAVAPAIQFTISGALLEKEMLSRINGSQLNIVLGSNTAVESVAAGRPTVIDPYIKPGLTPTLCEQVVRTTALCRFASSGVWVVGDEHRQNPEAFANLLTRAFRDYSAVLASPLATAGNRKAASFITNYLASHPRP
jgi:predicted glycosyltransferase